MIDTNILREKADTIAAYYGEPHATIVRNAADELDALRDELLERKETHRKTVLELTTAQQQLAEARKAAKRVDSALCHAVSCHYLGCPICTTLRHKYAAIEAAKGGKNV